MNKTININLGGQPFIMDDHAYESLSRYLSRIERHFSYSDGCAEIMEDIEMRIAELFTERLKTRSIVTSADFDAIVKIMGRPEDIGCSDDDIDYDKQESGYTEKQDSKIEFEVGKKLFRDEDNGVIGGVCAGFSKYLGIEDPVWVRILFAVLFFGLGIGGLAYFILWVAIPAAKTRHDRMEMKGKKIDINSIAQTIESEFNNLSESLSDMGELYKQRRETKRRS